MLAVVGGGFIRSVRLSGSINRTLQFLGLPEFIEKLPFDYVDYLNPGTVNLSSYVLFTSDFVINHQFIVAY